MVYNNIKDDIINHSKLLTLMSNGSVYLFHRIFNKHIHTIKLNIL